MDVPTVERKSTMATYPYVSGSKVIVDTFEQLRKQVPNKVDAGWFQRFNLAPGNESYVINILRFLGLIGEDGRKSDDKTGFFYSDDEAFQSGLEQLLREVYSELFAEMGDDALGNTREPLSKWFRGADKTSELVGKRQATTFGTLAALAGHGDLPAVRVSTPKGQNGSTKKSPPSNGRATAKASVQSPNQSETGAIKSELFAAPSHQAGVGLTVRIEVNLPAGGDAGTYDAIFASIRKHLMS
ncbi:DUF5343 domain-containing protein [Georgenia sp. SYP-B2076]|uniref:DUF5343 domain-containing protein n=1 Tax=Georgenia sp. SYP-B2076 TaxID=2495881 RepID=UPI000F8F06CD|nr:DUF5343 domain-containing protein [Georgenia sp. SYP-B2076]